MSDSPPRYAVLLFLTISLVAVAPAPAAELASGATLLAGTGWFDCNRRHDQAAEGRLEYRSRPLAPGLRVVAAALVTTDRAFFGGAGVAYEIRMGRWDITPSFVPGLYRHGDGRDLGYLLEFRTQAELGYRLHRGPRIAIAFSHLSNAGLGAHNPGQESLTINYEWASGGRRAR